MENPILPTAAAPAKKFLAVGVLPAGLQNYYTREAFRVIQPFAAEVAAMTGAEYSVYDTATAIDAGLCHFHVGYLCDKELTETEQQGYIVQKLSFVDQAARAAVASAGTPEAKKAAIAAANAADWAGRASDFAGYFLLKMQNPERDALHIWQVYIVKELRGRMEVFDPGFEQVKNAAGLFKAKVITMAGSYEQWHGVAERLGFMQGPTIYRMPVK